MSLKKFLKSTPFYKQYRLFLHVRRQIGLSPIKWITLLSRFNQDYQKIKSVTNPHYEIGSQYFDPYLLDNLDHTPIEPTYFYQDTWASGKIFKMKPESHVDIGSSAITVGIISQFVPTTFVDIRPIEVTLPNLTFIKGSITELPFKDLSIQSLSCLCVVEHIGLGRYGDQIDAFGSEKSIHELIRVLATKGDLYISLPVDATSRVYFNSCRAFTREHVIKLFEKLSLQEEKYHYGMNLYDHYDPGKGFGTGLFHFKKEKS